jgi:hypothetical protein
MFSSADVMVARCPRHPVLLNVVPAAARTAPTHVDAVLTYE